MGWISWLFTVVLSNNQCFPGTRTKTHQYSVTEYDTVVHKGEMQMPSVWFAYDISPISVTITESRKSFAHLLTRLCAVVGGVFAVTGELPMASSHLLLLLQCKWFAMPCTHQWFKTICNL